MTAPAATRTQSMFINRFAIGAMFFLLGAVFSTWASRIPDIQEKLALSEAQLGLTLLGMSVGLVVALPLVSGLISRFSSRSVTTAAAICFSLTAGTLGFANSAVVLWICLFFLGGFSGSLDVAMNAQAVEYERRLGKPVMSSFHAIFSIGFFVGAVVGTQSIALEITPRNLFIGTSIAYTLLVIAVMSNFLDVEGETDVDTASPTFSLPHPSLLLLGLVAFCAAVGEGSMADWSGVYLRRVVEAPVEYTGYGLAAFSIMMTVGRLAGDQLVVRFGHINVVRVSGVLAIAGFILAIAFPTLIPAVIGFGLVGAGVSTVIPLAFSVAGLSKTIPPGRAIAGVATLGYAGFLAGPPVIGFIAEGISLQAGLGFVLVLMVVMTLLSGRVKVPE